MQPDDTPPNQPAAEPAGAAETLASEVSRPGADSEEAPASLLDAALKALGSEVEGGRAEEVQDQPAQRETEPGHADAVVSSPVGQATADDIPHIPDEQFRALPKQVRTVINRLRQRVDALTPAAQQIGRIETFLKESGLTPEEFAEGQDVMALMKRDPRAALQHLERHVANLRAQLGVDLPDDLRRDVEDGYISEDRARELSQMRAEARLVRGRYEADLAARAADDSLRAVQAWERATAQSDPDFSRKLPIVMDKARIAVAALGRPVRGPDEALAIVRRAYDEANETLRVFLRPAAATPRSPSSSAAAPPSRVEPKDIYQAAMYALEGGM